jgi:cellulase (glycosyl hydrolase family 5)
MNRRAVIWLAASAVLALSPLTTATAQSAPARASAAAPQAGSSVRWTPAAANAWYARQPWLVGANYAPAYAINQLEMWQADSFDPAAIEREMTWAEGLGMNTMRVFLHDLLWQQDPEGFRKRIDTFLAISARHGVKPMFVLFDSCWDPNPQLGPQHRPIPGVHNSGWVQGPSNAALADPKEYPRLRAYVEGVVGAFANDPRVLAWDIWNEPDNSGGGSYNALRAKNEEDIVARLLPQAFAWARSQRPIQPLTSAVWRGEDWSKASNLNAVQRVQLEQSDVITFHNYFWPEDFQSKIDQLRGYGRPVICTEWLARSAGSNVDSHLPIAKRENVGMYNWGFVEGKIQTTLPWDSWERPYTLQQPTVWFHDLLRADGTPYRTREADLFRELTGRARAAAPAAR